VENLQVGGVDVAIYETPANKNGRIYPGFTAIFQSGEESRRLFRASKQDLRQELHKLFVGGDELTLRGPALREYERARQLAQSLGMELDEALLRLKKLDAASQETGTTIEQALDYHARHHDQSKFGVPCPQVVEAFLANRKLMGNSTEDIATLRCRLRRFAIEFGCPLRDITKDQYRKYFAATGRSLSDRRTHRSSVGRLVNWARDNDYLPADHPGIPRTGSRVQIPPKRVEVFDLDQRELLIAQARPVELPLTLMRAYLPIRAKECALVSWEDINWKTTTLTVYGDGAKTRDLRSVSLVPEVVARLEPYRKTEGRLYPFKNFYKIGPRLAKKAGLRWVRNGWRCSVISHLQAFVQDLGRVANEAGNSPTQIKRCYLKNLDAESGRAWFGLKSEQRHPLEPVRQVVAESQQRVVHVDAALLPGNVIPFVAVADQQ
jgi:integrase